MGRGLGLAWWGQLFLVGYLFILGALVLLVMGDVWTASYKIIDRLPTLDTATLSWDQKLDLKTFSYTVGGAVIGAVLINLKEVLTPSRAVQSMPWNRTIAVLLAGPWVALLLGAAVYMLVRGGVLVYGGGVSPNQVSNAGDPNPITSFGYLAIGVVSGAGWKRMLGVVGGLSGRFTIADDTQADDAQGVGARPE